MGDSHTCALFIDSTTVHCWGYWEWVGLGNRGVNQLTPDVDLGLVESMALSSILLGAWSFKVY